MPSSRALTLHVDALEPACYSVAWNCPCGQRVSQIRHTNMTVSEIRQDVRQHPKCPGCRMRENASQGNEHSEIPLP